MSSLPETPALLPPSIEDFQNLASAAWASMPDGFRKMCGRVDIFIADFADDETLAELGLDNPFELTGVYMGVDLARKSVIDPSPEPDRVFLYRRPILDEWAERGDVPLDELVAHVLVHEIGHHFGLSDDDMHRIEDEAE
ncbi:metallopeptidase family protein [Maricaulis sp. CAU 1757]